jgi:EmrB/QacA subfamily drug resistance transporter
MERKWWTLLAVCVGTFMLLLDVTIVNVALPDIQRSLHSSFSDLQWTINAYALTLAALLLTAGSLADMYGRRLLFAIGLVLFTSASALCGVASSALFLIVSRGVQGIGGAIMFATALALLAQAFRGHERGVAFSIWGAVTGIAVAVGPVIGGALTSGLSWRWIFFVNLPIGVLALAVTLRKVDESREPYARRPDWAGVVTFSGSLGSLIYGLIKANDLGWGSTTIVACFAASVVLMAAFVVLESVQKTPMFDLSLFRKPTFTGGAVVAFAISGSLFAMFLWLTLYLQNILGYSPLQTGLRLIAISGGIFVASAAAGRLTTKVPVRLLLGTGLALIGTGLLLMRGITLGDGWTHLLPGFIVAGIGVGFVNPPLASTAIGVVEPRRAGMASGINSTFRQVGIATGIAALGAIFESQVRTHATSALAGIRGLSAGHVHQISEQLATGGAAHAIAGTPPSLRGAVAHASASSFIAGLNEIMLVAAILAFAGSVLAYVLVRNRDFVAAPAMEAAAAAA